MTLEFLPQKRIIIGTFVAILALYALFQSRNLLLGPQIKISEPIENATVIGPTISVTGTARNVSFISLNDRQIYVNDEGIFSESLLLSDGLAVLKLRGTDRFGHVKEVVRSIVVKI